MLEINLGLKKNCPTRAGNIIFLKCCQFEIWPFIYELYSDPIQFKRYKQEVSSIWSDPKFGLG